MANIKLLPQLPLVAILLVSCCVLCLWAGSLQASDDNDENDRLFHEGIDHPHGQHAGPASSPPPNQLLPKDKLLLSDVKVLTFTRNKRTTSRRTHSIHQLSCVGGTAGCKLFTPNVVECHNAGLDKKTGKLQWRCQAEMSDRVKFNHVDVICEGYDYPEDDYILLGSCGLEFTLDYADPHDYHDQSYFKHMDEHEKKLHYERVRGQNEPAKTTSKPSISIQWLYTQITDYSLFLIVLFVLIVILTLVRSGLYSGLKATQATNMSRGKRQSAVGGGGGGSGRYGPLTSAVMTTKKAC